jgi:hypothetical protein
VKYFFDNHPNDPVAHFGYDLLWSKPGDWGPNMRWEPVSSFFRELHALPGCLKPIPGKFEANEHDYRLDKVPLINACLVRLTFGQMATPQQQEAVLKAMKSRELVRAQEDAPPKRPHQGITERLRNLEAMVNGVAKAITWGG